MPTVNMNEARSRLSSLISRIEAGETFLITRAGKPVAQLVSLTAAGSTGPRKLGLGKCAFTFPEDFDRLGTAHVASMFEPAPR